MPAKKPTSKKRIKPHRTKRAENVLPLVSLDGSPKAWPPERAARQRSSKRNVGKMIRVWGDSDIPSMSKSEGRRTVKMMPNPWPPDNIETLLTIACSAYGGMKLAKIVYETIKLWVDLRKVRKVRVKKGGIEIEIEAGMTVREIEKTIDLLVKKTKGLEDEKPKIILPSGIDKSIPKKEQER
jgi:hypothetical protein